MTMIAYHMTDDPAFTPSDERTVADLMHQCATKVGRIVDAEVVGPRDARRVLFLFDDPVHLDPDEEFAGWKWWADQRYVATVEVPDDCPVADGRWFDGELIVGYPSRCRVVRMQTLEEFKREHGVGDPYYPTEYEESPTEEPCACGVCQESLEEEESPWI